MEDCSFEVGESSSWYLSSDFEVHVVIIILFLYVFSICKSTNLGFTLSIRVGDSSHATFK